MGQNRDICQDAELSRFASGPETSLWLDGVLACGTDGFVALDERGRVLAWNPAMAAITEVPEAEALGVPLWSLYDAPGVEPSADVIRSLFTRCIASGQLPADFPDEVRIRTPLGTAKTLQVRLFSVPGTNAYRLGLLCRDVTARKTAETLRDRSERRYRRIVETVPFAVIHFDLDYVIREWNPAAERIFGWTRTEAVGRNEFDLISLDRSNDNLKKRLLQRLHATGLSTNQNENVTKDGRVITCRWMDVLLRDPDGEPEGVLATAIEVTDQIRLERRLREALKQEWLGRLAGGIAHDFNNLLASTLGNLELLFYELQGRAGGVEMARDAYRSASRAAELTRRLLSFSQRQMLQARAVDVSEMVRRLRPQIESDLGPGVLLELALEKGLPRVRIDEEHVREAILQLVDNALGALAGGGTLALETLQSTLERPIEGQSTIPAGRYVMIRVRDSGAGMDAVTRGRAFEPFFSTKGPGGGSGLGLPSVYGTVRQNGGYVVLESESGEGTCVSIYFPLQALEGDLPNTQNR